MFIKNQGTNASPGQRRPWVPQERRLQTAAEMELDDLSHVRIRIVGVLELDAQK